MDGEAERMREELREGIQTGKSREKNIGTGIDILTEDGPTDRRAGKRPKQTKMQRQRHTNENICEHV